MSYIYNPTPAEADLLQRIASNESSNDYLARISQATCLKLTGRTDCTASGAYQFTNATWRDATQATGVPYYPSAADAPADVQDTNALWLLRTRGTAPWASSGPYDTATQPLVDLSGEAAATPTATIMDQLQAQAASVGIDVTSPVTDLLVAAGVTAAAYLFARAL
jgi:hypothetical protein